MYEELTAAMSQPTRTPAHGPQFAVPTLPPPPMQMGQQMPLNPQMPQQMGMQPQMPQQQMQQQPQAMPPPPVNPYEIGPLGMAPGTPLGPPQGVPPLRR